MFLVLLLASAALLADCRAAVVTKHMPIIDFDNNIAHIGLPANAVKRFVKLAVRPEPSYGLKHGYSLDLVCDAVGAPAPSVRWFKNDAPVYEHDIESNEVINSNPLSVGRLTSTLLVSRGAGRDQYSCLATAGDKSVRASTVVYSKDGGMDISERSKLYPLIPRVVAWYKVYLGTIGNNAVLPCRSKGHPRPNVSWRDNEGNLITNNPRMKVLRSGELVITALRWSDMGEFKCRAFNAFGSASATTFLYPAKACQPI